MLNRYRIELIITSTHDMPHGELIRGRKLTDDAYQYFFGCRTQSITLAVIELQKQMRAVSIIPRKYEIIQIEKLI